MISLKKNGQSGFTIVELLIVIIIIGILAGLVITQVLGANQQARDTDRKNDINSIATQLESYFAKSGGYPALADINSGTWRTANSFNAGDGAKALSDPMTNTVTTLAASVPATATGNYAYVPGPASCVSPTDNTGAANTGTFCNSYTLTALLENKKDTQKDSTSTTTQTFYIKKNANQ